MTTTFRYSDFIIHSRTSKCPRSLSVPLRLYNITPKMAQMQAWLLTICAALATLDWLLGEARGVIENMLFLATMAIIVSCFIFGEVKSVYFSQ